LLVITWVVIGFLAAYIASKLFNRKGEGVGSDFIVGIAGAIFGGYAFSMVGATAPATFTFFGLVFAVAGAAVFLAMYRAIFRRA
jgi:uncharacterized membrane protein YeaQ/YmgE (transglycosylase-associated protein family)